MNQQVRLSAVATAVSLALSGTAIAQQGDPLEEVVVTGIRGSLTNAMDIKRTSSGVVDAISAEDIGKFPDTNLAESLQRITGVSIDRANNEGNKITVRGFGPNFNLVLLNGRQMPNSSSLVSAGVNRSFDFAEISAESVSGVEVYKTTKAHVPSGGIGSTVNIKTARPFDFPGFQAVASAKGVFDTTVEAGDDVTPEISGMISQTFMDGQFGVLLSASHAERDSRLERIGTQGWVRNRGNRDNIDTSAIDTSNNPGLAFWTPWTSDLDVWDLERERQNAQLVLQYAPLDTLTVTADYTLSNFEEAVNMNRQSFWFDNPSGAADANGTVVDVSSSPADLDFWAWEFFNESENRSIGLNLDWQATDTLNLALDYHESSSHSNPDGRTGETLSNIRNIQGSITSIGADFSGEIPAVRFDDAALPGGAFDPNNIVADLFQKRGYEMDNDIQQIQLHGKWANEDDGALSSINFGLASTVYKFDTFLTATFSFVDPLFAGVNLDLAPLGLTFQPRGDTGDQFSGVQNSFPFIPQYDIGAFINIVEDAGLFFVNPPTINGIEEDTTAAYVSFDFSTEFNGMPVDLNVGVRYEDTDVDSFSVQPGIVALNFRVPEELQPIFEENATPQNLKGNYTRWLPNFDFRMDVTETLTTRLSFGTTITRADIGAMFPSTNLNAPRPGDPFRASQGNPNLLPFLSDNLDLSVEWYYADGSYASVGYFKKWVENFIGAGVEDRVILNTSGDPLTDPSVNPRAGCPDASNPPNPNCLSQAGDPVITWEVTTPQNLGERVVDGWEFNVQHLFGDSGFGGIVNFTLVDVDQPIDLFSFSGIGGIAGLSDSANVVAFYEQGPWQARVAYNWRDDFLAGGGAEPIFTEEYGQFDISASYDVTDSITIFAEGLNVTDETTRRYLRFPNQLSSAEQYGARYAVGIRANFE